MFIGTDNLKRMEWPIGKVTGLFHGNDGQIRLVKVKTTKCQLLLWLVQRYYLECGREPIEFSKMRLEDENIIYQPISNEKEMESTKALSDQEDDVLCLVFLFRLYFVKSTVRIHRVS